MFVPDSFLLRHTVYSLDQCDRVLCPFLGGSASGLTSSADYDDDKVWLIHTGDGGSNTEYV